MKAYPVKHLIVCHSLKRSSFKKVLSPASHSLIVSFPSIIHCLPSLTVFPPQRIHPKFNYFWGGFSKRNGALSQHSWGFDLALRNASPSHTNNFSNWRLRLYCFTTAHQMDIEMMIYKDHSFETCLALSHVLMGRSHWRTTAHFWCF